MWVHHLRLGNEDLRHLLSDGKALMHPFILGELSCGTMKNRAEVLELLNSLRQAVVAEHDEVMKFLNEQQLYGQGLGWIDLHLLASASLSRAALWTTDRPLKRAATQLGISS